MNPGIYKEQTFGAVVSKILRWHWPLLRHPKMMNWWAFDELLLTSNIFDVFLVNCEKCQPTSAIFRSRNVWKMRNNFDFFQQSWYVHRSRRSVDASTANYQHRRRRVNAAQVAEMHFLHFSNSLCRSTRESFLACSFTLWYSTEFRYSWGCFWILIARLNSHCLS